MSQQGRLIVISGPSGVGKTTVCDELKKLPGFERVITYTTREPRAGEVPGVHYNFVTESAFQEGIARGKFLEHARVHSCLYGTPRAEVEEAIARGKWVLLSIDTKGAAQLRDLEDLRGRMTSIFLMPPDERTLEARLAGRGTENKPRIEERLQTARGEIKEKDAYDHVVINRDLARTVEEILQNIGYDASTNRRNEHAQA